MEQQDLLLGVINSAGNTLSLSNPTPVSNNIEKFTFDLSDTFYIDDEKSATNTSGINITGSGNNMEDLAGSNNLGPLPSDSYGLQHYK